MLLQTVSRKAKGGGGGKIGSDEAGKTVLNVDVFLEALLFYSQLFLCLSLFNPYVLRVLVWVCFFVCLFVYVFGKIDYDIKKQQFFFNGWGKHFLINTSTVYNIFLCFTMTCIRVKKFTNTTLIFLSSLFLYNLIAFRRKIFAIVSCSILILYGNYYSFYVYVWNAFFSLVFIFFYNENWLHEILVCVCFSFKYIAINTTSSGSHTYVNQHRFISCLVCFFL